MHPSHILTDRSALGLVEDNGYDLLLFHLISEIHSPLHFQLDRRLTSSQQLYYFLMVVPFYGYVVDLNRYVRNLAFARTIPTNIRTFSITSSTFKLAESAGSAFTCFTT